MNIKNKNKLEELSSQKMVNRLRLLIDNINDLHVNLNDSSSTKIMLEYNEILFQLNIYNDTVESIVLYDDYIELTRVKIELYFITSQVGVKLIIKFADNQKKVYHFHELCEMLDIKTSNIRDLFDKLTQIKEKNISDLLFSKSMTHTHQSYMKMKTNTNELIAA
jgi:hypothetical protein